MVEDTGKTMQYRSGFRSGFKQGAGFMTGVALVLAILASGALAVGWWTFGSVKAAVASAMRDVTVEATASTRKAVQDGREEAARLKDKAVAGATDAAHTVGEKARIAGEVVTDAGSSLKDKAAGFGSVLKERAASVKERWGGTREEPSPPVPPAEVQADPAAKP